VRPGLQESANCLHLLRSVAQLPHLRLQPRLGGRALSNASRRFLRKNYEGTIRGGASVAHNFGNLCAPRLRLVGVADFHLPLLRGHHPVVLPAAHPSHRGVERTRGGAEWHARVIGGGGGGARGPRPAAA
jgi:hypothetical protein